MGGFKGDGSFDFTYNMVAESAAGVKILSSHQQANWDDAIAGFGNCLTRDGQGKPSANQNFNTKIATNMGSGSAATDSANLGDVYNWGRADNFCFNPFMQVWQRGTTITPGAAGGWTADRWYLVRDGVATGVTATAETADTGNPFYTSAKIQRTAGNTDAAQIEFTQSFESIDSKALIAFATQNSNSDIGVAVWVRAGANFSGGTVTLRLWSGDTANSGPASNTWFGETSVSITPPAGNYQRITLVKFGTAWTYTNAVKVSLLWAGSTTPAGADDSLHITGFQLVAFPKLGTSGGAVANVNVPPAIQLENYVDAKRKCERYYQVYGGAANAILFAGYATNAGGGVWDHTIVLPTQMRIAPTATVVGTWAKVNCTGPTVPVTAPNSIVLRATPASPAYTSFNTDSNDDVITLDAELV